MNQICVSLKKIHVVPSKTYILFFTVFSKERQSPNIADFKEQRKREKHRIEKERKEQKEREKKENEMRKKFKVRVKFSFDIVFNMTRLRK